MKAYFTPIFLNSSRVQPSSWSTLLAETSGQFVYQTSFQFNATVLSFGAALLLVFSMIRSFPVERVVDETALQGDEPCGLSQSAQKLSLWARESMPPASVLAWKPFCNSTRVA